MLRRRRLRSLPCLRRNPPEREADRVALAHRERGAHRAAVDLGRHARAHRDLVRSSERAASVLGRAEEGAHEAVLGSGRQLHHELHGSLEPLDGAKELVRGVDADVVAPLPVGERERVAQANGSRRRRELRLEHE